MNTININQFANLTRENNFNSKDFNWNGNFQNANLNLLNSTSLIKDEFQSYKKKRNFVEKTVDGVRNFTHIGFGTNKAKKAIENAGNQDEANKAFNKYKAINETGAQTVGDTASAAIGLGLFYATLKGAKYLNSMNELNAMPNLIKEAIEDIPKDIGKKVLTSVQNIASSNAKTAALGLGLSALAGGIIKKVILKPKNKKYKLDKEQKALPKAEKKALKKELRKTERKENGRNFLTGAINGALSPLASMAGIVGAPLYLATSFILRHKTAMNDNGSIKEDLKNNAVVTSLGAALTAIPMIKSHKAHQIFVQNMDKVVAELKNVELQKPDFEIGKTKYQELEEILLKNSKIKAILESDKPAEEIITELTDENIFAVKFKQIAHDGDEITRALRENCPATRTLKEAQTVINGLSGGENYSVKKLLGVGTVAETYLAEDKNGKEVCVKILKEGISKEKILADKEKFQQIITGGTPFEQLSEAKKNILRNLDNLSDGILKEVDFKNEMEAAKKLKKYTTGANVVTPICAKDGIYVMERANGISLDSLAKYYSEQSLLNYYEKELPKALELGDEYDIAYYQKQIKETQKRIAKIKERTPDFAEIDLSSSEIKKLLTQYIDVYTEQFDKIQKGGKTIHADIHPGNIFIDLENLKSGKGKLFTLIDTGNTVDLSAEQSKRALQLTNYVQNGNTKDIASYVLEGAILPEGMKYEEAYKNVEGELNKLFFDTKTSLPFVNAENIITTTDGIMKKYGIISSDTQLNLNKAKKSAINSLGSLLDTFFEKKYGNVEGPNVGAFANLTKDAATIGGKKVSASKIQQFKNLFQNSPSDIIKELKNKNANKTNSKEYLTYKMKQFMNKDTAISF